MSRLVRCQAAILQDSHLLLIYNTDLATGRGYWVIPGGGQEPGESEEACVAREANEETNLVIEVKYLLMEEPAAGGLLFKYRRTYACEILSGRPSPGCEPEPEAAAQSKITAVRWIDFFQ
ncbi:MAG: NUDIX hydrolase [Anaerolineales bacterium]|nr:NUDIX hydrolase [Anaerolineales bacterium]